MSLTFCNVHFSPKPEKVVYISNTLLKSLKLSGKKKHPASAWQRFDSCCRKTDQEVGKASFSWVDGPQRHSCSLSRRCLSAYPGK